MNNPKKSSFTLIITVVLSLLIVVIMGIGVFVIISSINKKDPLDKYTTPQTQHSMSLTASSVAFSETDKKFTVSIRKGEIIQARALRIDSDEDLKQLQNMRLNAVIIHGADISGEGLQYLTKIPSLSELTILDLSDVGENIKYLGQIENLKMLRIHSESINNSWLEAFSNLKKLVSIDLTSSRITDKGIVALEKLPLQSASIHSDAITDNAADSLSKMKYLNTIQLRGSGLGPHLFEKLSKIKSLKCLEVDEIKSTSETDLKYLNSMPLVNLFLGSVTENPENYFSALSRTPLPQSVSALRFTGVDFAGRNILCLRNLPKLKAICFAESPHLSDDVIEHLLKLKPEVVEFRHSGLKDKQLGKLSKLGSMKQLSIPDCPELTLEAVEDFRRNYKAIWNRECPVSLAGAGGSQCQ